ncbi:hypothetical protein [Encephalitozoon cuniculi GB-M1]|uniref:DNA replication complex GINS protein PSF3 n=2 Tax=Encephalitozoon cuniculi TaxID=6035 RepID=Q8SU47_ENCCU|nr:uncharacterized protein ECU11_0920 [Encephalitozoon cuniculi GB-M1]AGE94983.1 hypothetical protein ECU11_0920 [Encephalitozoon cuniculi]KMV65050.1 hypothetical protein M970_110910 [Encephalitozoon cuniculi EcunIII-L]UYI26295.1 GINs complex subunit 3 [Encephalitozoon cuniculi]CAD26002.1 hypothetical protein [Encephalitozoon cuniculi GB-M1]
MEYYSPDDILLGESRIQVTFKHKIRNFGFLGPRPKILPENRRVEVPYFLVSFLLRNGHCELGEGFLKESLLEDIRAKPSTVDLRSVCPYFFYLYAMLLGEGAGLPEFFYERVGDYSSLVLKKTFSEDDVWRLDMVERSLVVGSRRRFQRFCAFLVARH